MSGDIGFDWDTAIAVLEAMVDRITDRKDAS